ncbi:putative phosphatase [Acinetobacter phage vB_AbaM_P1]|nr:putative phosphatase [Acinetobacter phage vB_AbaM_P1]
MIEERIKGDVFPYLLKKDNNFDAFVHGCNCFCTMGKGIAPLVKKHFYAAYEADLLTKKGDRSKLGDYTWAWFNEYKLEIINAYTQYDYRKAYGDTDINVSYHAIREVFRKLNKDYRGCRFAIPKIGAGLAGGDWELIEKIINEETPHLHITLFYLED